MSENHWDHENLTALEGLQAGQVEPLIALLKETTRPLHPELRQWLAAMLSGDAQSRWRLICARHPGFPQGDDWRLAVRNVRIGRRIHELWQSGASITEAKGSAVYEFGLRERTIDSAWSAYRRVYFMLESEGAPMSSDLRPLRRPKS